jgi:hypothetical protein
VAPQVEELTPAEMKAIGLFFQAKEFGGRR